MDAAELERQARELRIAREQQKRDLEREARRDQDRQLVLQRQELERKLREGR